MKPTKAAMILGALAVAAAVPSGCMTSEIEETLMGSYEFEVPDLEGGWYVLRWQEPLQSGERDTRFKWSCFVLDDPEGRRLLEDWVRAHWAVLRRPKAYPPLRVVPTRQLAWFRDESLEHEWSLWMRAPSVGPCWPRKSRLDLVACPWAENLPDREFERLKEIFMARGRPVDPDRADLRESLGPVSDQARLIFRGGKYVLRQRVTDKGNSPTDRWVSRTIDTPEGRKAVEEWIAANYEALKCAAIALPGLQVLLERRLLWYDDRFCVLVELMEKIPVGGKYADTENMEYVDNLPTSAMERLRSLFQQYGSITEFDPDVLADTHTWVDLAD